MSKKKTQTIEWRQSRTHNEYRNEVKIYNFEFDRKAWKAEFRGRTVVFISPNGRELEVPREDVVLPLTDWYTNWCTDHLKQVEYLQGFLKSNFKRLTAPKKQGERIIEIGDERWGWIMGRGDKVVIVAPSRKQTAVRKSDLVTATITYSVDLCGCGCDYYIEDRVQDGVVTPKVIRSYIDEHRDALIGEKTSTKRRGGPRIHARSKRSM